MNEQQSTLEDMLIELFPNLATRRPIQPHSMLRDDLGLDSLDLVNLMVAIEDAFEIRFDPIETDLADVFYTVGSLAAYLAHTLQT